MDQSIKMSINPLCNYIQEICDISNNQMSNKNYEFRKARLQYLIRSQKELEKNLQNRANGEKYKQISLEIIRLERDIVIDCENHGFEPFIVCKHCNIKMKKPYTDEIEYFKLKRQEEFDKITSEIYS